MAQEAFSRSRRYLPAIGPRLRRLLTVLFASFALLGVNSVYLLGIRLLEQATGKAYQNWFYLNMFLLHLLLGWLIVVPVAVFGALHVRNAHNRPNRRAVRVGYGLLTVVLVLVASGIVLTRLEGFLVVKDPAVRSVAWWAHVVSPLAAVWLFVLHRLAGKRIRWEVGARWAVAAGVFAVALVALHSLDPRTWSAAGPASGERYFYPSLARTATGKFIPARVLMNDSYCQECHPTIHQRWSNSVHRFSSFNNPPYLFSVRETRQVARQRDGNVQASRFCAGCHDPVVFFSGKFDDPGFDDVKDPTAHAGITCTVCHSINHVNSVRGNADYTIEEPIHYPFAFSDNRVLRFVNRQLIKAKPELHKKVFLKPLHKTPEFCASCHKVNLPVELNKYRWLRGQNHYDSYFLSGVSGHGVASFYYPPKAIHNCNQCHMKLRASDDFGARTYEGSRELQVHDHLFPSANTAIPHLLRLPAWVQEEHRKFNEGVMRVDIFGLRNGRTVDSPLIAPLRPKAPAVADGEFYLFDVVVRTVKMGHHFTQGTADSNEVWLDVTVKSGDRFLGRSGGLGPLNEVDPWTHFVNVYALDRNGNRIDRRNAQDIYVPLYNHQIPPGSADTIHFQLKVLPGMTAPVTIEVKLNYRKFDTTYMKYVYGPRYVNNLPIMTLASDRMVLPLAGVAEDVTNGESPIPLWERWNDYGIGLLNRGELRQAEEAFTMVESLGRPDGPLNLARVYLAQGAVETKAVEALRRAARFDPPPPPWTLAWLSGLVDKQNGHLDAAIASFRSLLAADDAELRRREFDFSKDYRLLNELGQTLYERALEEPSRGRRAELLREARGTFERTLALDPEDAVAHFNLARVCGELGEAKLAMAHQALFEKYKTDDNARNRIVAAHWWKNPAALPAAATVALYDASRPDVYDLFYQYTLDERGRPVATGFIPGRED